jgi:polysaccharide biosynthesis protein PelF
MTDEKLPKSDRVDIMLLLEGTFPYVSGGVSSWVNQIIRGFPEYRFGAVFIGSSREDYSTMKYELPANLVHLETAFLHDNQRKSEIKPVSGNRGAFETVRRLHDWFMSRDSIMPDESYRSIDFFLDHHTGIDYQQFLHARNSWDFITDMFEGRCSDPSFVDYFWTVRNMHAPVWTLAGIADRLIPARIFHTVSTGYAGFLGSLLHHHTGRPLILSEHGIYTKERRIDIFNSNWIQDNRNALQRDPTEVSYFRDLWIRFFETMGRFCYDAAGNIISLFEGARERQIADGAPEDHTRVISNGVDIARYASLRSKRPTSTPPVLTLLGRVVPIKDIKTFVRAIRIIANHLPEIEGWIIGPQDEDPEYSAECHALADSLAISDRVHFKGFQDPTDVFPKTGLLVLSSISEGLPLVIIESFAAGVPAVATDVGSCRQLIMGLGDEDEAIGAAGSVVGINDPHSLAEECLRLLTNQKLWDQSQHAAIKRVERFYSQKQMFDSYSELYAGGMS